MTAHRFVKSPNYALVKFVYQQIGNSEHQRRSLSLAIASHC